MAVHAAFNIATFLPATLTAPELTEDQFLALCEKFPDSMLEYSRDGTLIIMPPSDPETGARTSLLVYALVDWAKKTGLGTVSGPDAGFRFKDRSRRSPDAAWYNKERWRKAKESGQPFPVFAPEFVIELRSPNDKIWLLQEKMEEYIDNGVQLAWLIDPAERTVTIYRSGRTLEVLSNPATVAGEGPVVGFVLNLDGIL
jgi:Uma2 family endonuclease